MDMDCAKRGKNQDTVELYPDSLLKKLKIKNKNKNKNVNVNIIKINMPSARSSRRKSKPKRKDGPEGPDGPDRRNDVARIARGIPLGQHIRFQTAGHHFANMPLPLVSSTYGRPTSAVQPVYHIGGSQETLKKTFYDMERNKEDDFKDYQDTNPKDIVPDLSPSVRAVPSIPTANPYDLDAGTTLVETVDTPVPVGKHPEQFNSMYKAPMLYATLTDDDEPNDEVGQASHWIYKDPEEDIAKEQAGSVFDDNQVVTAFEEDAKQEAMSSQEGISGISTPGAYRQGPSVSAMPVDTELQMALAKEYAKKHSKYLVKIFEEFPPIKENEDYGRFMGGPRSKFGILPDGRLVSMPFSNNQVAVVKRKSAQPAKACGGSVF